MQASKLNVKSKNEQKEKKEVKLISLINMINHRMNYFDFSFFTKKFQLSGYIFYAAFPSYFCRRWKSSYLDLLFLKGFIRTQIRILTAKKLFFESARFLELLKLGW